MDCKDALDNFPSDNFRRSKREELVPPSLTSLLPSTISEAVTSFSLWMTESQASIMAI